MERALELAALAATQDEVPVGAIIVFENQIVGEGYNQREQKQSPLSHAETEAIEAAAKKLGSWRLLDCDLYVTLEPCPMCLAACQQARIRKIYYATPDPKGGALSLGYALHADPKFNHRFEVQQTPDDRAAQLLKDFFKSKRKGKVD